MHSVNTVSTVQFFFILYKVPLCTVPFQLINEKMKKRVRENPGYWSRLHSPKEKALELHVLSWSQSTSCPPLEPMLSPNPAIDLRRSIGSNIPRMDSSFAF
jgi:hypothetical protein